MAWRIHDHVLRGEIDNRQRGQVRGRVWLAGIAEPLMLNLLGDAEPDLAGCRLVFENPQPLPFITRSPIFRQNGTVGYFTAARKVRVFDIPTEEAYLMRKVGGTPPVHMANCLYLQWFSEQYGEVVIESADYRLEISEPAWSYTAEELVERARLEAENADAPFAVSIDADGEIEEWDAFHCEQLLGESDAVTNRYDRLWEKYKNHPDRERLIALEMGWPWKE